MKGPELLPDNPFSLASIRAEEGALSFTESFEGPISAEEERRVIELDYAASSLGFIGKKYFIESRKSVSIPFRCEDPDNVSYLDCVNLAFEGSFTTYSQVMIGKILGAHTVRALCMAFHDVTMLTYHESLPDDHLLHVPVLAVESINQQAA